MEQVAGETADSKVYFKDKSIDHLRSGKGFWRRYFSTIFSFLERILKELINMKISLGSKLQICSIRSIRIRSRIWHIFEKPV